VLDKPQIFRKDTIISEAHLCKIWLQKTKHQKTNALRNNFLHLDFLGKCFASHAHSNMVMVYSCIFETQITKKHECSKGENNSIKEQN